MQQHNGLGLQFYHRVNSAGRTGRRSTEMWTWPEKDREDHLPCDRPYLRCGGSAATLQGLAPLGFPASAVSTAQSSFCPLLTPRLHLNAFLLFCLLPFLPFCLVSFLSSILCVKTNCTASSLSYPSVSIFVCTATTEFTPPTCRVHLLTFLIR
jgi:hypothetical protein